MKTAILLMGILLILAIVVLIAAGVAHWKRGNDLLEEIKKWEEAQK